MVLEEIRETYLENRKKQSRSQKLLIMISKLREEIKAEQDKF